MNRITFDFSKVDPKAHETLMAHMTAIGYELIEPTKVPITKDEPLIIPPLHTFHIPVGATIDAVKIHVPISDEFKISITDDNFDTPIQRGRRIGGFYDIKRIFQSQEAVDIIAKLAQQTGRKFRVGAPLEAFLFWMENHTRCPEYFAVFGKVWNGKIIHKERLGFEICNWNGGWGDFRKVFIVEELEP